MPIRQRSIFHRQGEAEESLLALFAAVAERGSTDERRRSREQWLMLREPSHEDLMREEGSASSEDWYRVHAKFLLPCDIMWCYPFSR
jgi:hypothetical protein